MAHGRDLTGQVALVTGANSGVGWQTVRTLALQGCQVLNHPSLLTTQPWPLVSFLAQVVLACRSEAEAGAKLAMLKTERANVQASFLLIDLARFLMAELNTRLTINCVQLDKCPESSKTVSPVSQKA